MTVRPDPITGLPVIQPKIVVSGGGGKGGTPLPDQTGNNGKYLKTNGTTASWETVSGGGGGGTVDSIVAGNNIDVDATDPANPVVSVETLTLADLSDVTATASELNTLDGITATTTELNYVAGTTSAIQTQLNGKAASSHTHAQADITDLTSDLSDKLENITGLITDGSNVTITGTGTAGDPYEISASGGGGGGGDMLAATYDPQNIADDAFDRANHTGTQALSTITSVTATAAEVNVLDGITATTAELNKLAGATASTTEFNYVTGVTSSIQTQLDGKQAANSDLTDLVARWIPASSASAASLDFAEDTDNGSNRVRLIGATSTSDVTVTLPSTTGTLYVSGGTDVAVADGGTGRSTNTTAYGLIAAGTSATNAMQTIAPGTSGHFLKSAGASALASFAAIQLSDLSDASTVATLTGSQILQNKTLRAPLFESGGQILDVNSNQLIEFGGTVTSAVNNILIRNASTGNKPTIEAAGDDTNITLNFIPKGTGTLQANGVDVVTTSGTQTLSNKTLTTPTISLFTNATHDHSNAAGGGTLTHTALPAGAIVQVVSASFAASATGTTQIPLDDTIPQNTEGTEFMTLAITPKSTTNRLIIESTLSVAYSVAAHKIAALFQDSTANALAAADEFQNTGGGINTIKLIYEMAAGTTSSTTFKIRAGANTAGTMTFNGESGARRFGGITKSSMVIYEVKA